MRNELEERPVMKKVLENSVWGFFAMMITRGGAFIFSIILARFLLPERYGLFSLAMSVAFFISAFSGLGIDSAMVRYLAYAVGKNDKKRAGAYFHYILRIKLVLTLITSFVLVAGAYPLSVYLFDNIELFPLLVLFGIYIIVLPLGDLLGSVFSALKRTDYYSAKEAIMQVVRIVLVVLMFYVISPEFQVLGVIVVLIVAAIAGGVFSYFASRKIAGYVYEKGKLAEEDSKKVLMFLKAAIVIGLSGIAFGYVDSIMLGAFISETEYIGYYRAALTIIFSLSGLVALNSILLPFFTQFKKEAINRTLTKALRYTLILAVPAVFGILVIGRYLIKAIYGEEYLPAVIPLSVLSLLLISEGISGLFGIIFAAREKPQETVKIYLTASLMNVVLNVVLIVALLKISPVWAVAGAAVSTVISRYYYMLGVVYKAGKVLDAKADFKVILKPLLSSAIMAVALIIALNLIQDVNVYWGAGLVLLGIAVYFASMLVLKGINEEDVALAKGFIAKKLSS